MPSNEGCLIPMILNTRIYCSNIGQFPNQSVMRKITGATKSAGVVLDRAFSCSAKYFFTPTVLYVNLGIWLPSGFLEV